VLRAKAIKSKVRSGVEEMFTVRQLAKSNIALPLDETDLEGQ
jgi:hypothetical protein